MKLRIKGNSLRIRLTRTEVKTLSETGFLEEKTEFPSGTFRYAVRSVASIPEMSANLENGSVILDVPSQFVASWYEANTVGMKSMQQLPGGQILSLLLEKDFVCLDDTEEDQSDNYQNPKANC